MTDPITSFGHFVLALARRAFGFAAQAIEHVEADDREAERQRAPDTGQEAS